MSEFSLSVAIENQLVELNHRHMQTISKNLKPGYCLRAAKLLYQARGNVIIGTGFPVAGTFETDGPVGAIVLYQELQRSGCTPWIACAPKLAEVLKEDYRILALPVNDFDAATDFAQKKLSELQPEVILSIERPGMTSDGNYYNMRGENISREAAIFDPFFKLSKCPTIGIGDGGNEIGMGNILPVLEDLKLVASTTTCDELIVADVSNWGAYGLLAFLNLWNYSQLLTDISHSNLIERMVSNGACDGVTKKNTISEDGFPAEKGAKLIKNLSNLIVNHKTQRQMACKE